MNILLVSNSVDGGAGKACLRQFYALRRNGQNVKLLQLEGWASGDPDIVSLYPSVRELFLRQIGSFPFKTMKHVLMGDFRRQYRLPSSIHRLEEHPLIAWADVINLHWVPEFVDYRKFFRRIGRKPVVWTMHDMLPFAGGYHYKSELPQRRNLRAEERIARIKRASMQEANIAVVAPSEWLLTVSKKHRTFPECPHKHIFNCLPLNVYKSVDKDVARSVLNLPRDRKIVMFTAHSISSARKGGRHLASALAQLARSDVLLVSVGRTRMQLDASIDYQHLGYFADEVSMSLCYSSADLIAIPSLEDNSPNIIIESFACGRPVVAFNVGGIGELVNSADLGILVEGTNGPAFAKGIDKALTTEFDSNKIKTNAAERFGYENFSEKYIGLLTELTDH